MHIVKPLLILLSMGLCWVSCKQATDDSILLQKVERGDYVDKIRVEGTLEAVRTHNITCPSSIYRGILQYIIPEGSYVDQGDTVAVIESRELENEYTEALKQLEIAKSNYNESKANLELEKSNLLSEYGRIENNARRSGLDSVQLKFVTPTERTMIQYELEKAAIEKRRISKQLDLLENINKNELKQKAIMIRKMENRLERTREKLDELVLTTTTPGIVMHHRNYRTREKILEGDPVRRRLPIVQIPDVSEYQVNMKVLEADYKRIKKGQEVRITLDAYPEMTLEGNIKQIAPVGIPIERGSQIKEFEILASVQNLEEKMEPGITANCDIIIRRIEDTLMVPAVAVFEEDSLRYVYRLHRNKYVKQAVETVVSNNIKTVIKAGLSGEERIALQQPADSKIHKN